MPGQIVPAWIPSLGEYRPVEILYCKHKACILIVRGYYSMEKGKELFYKLKNGTKWEHHILPNMFGKEAKENKLSIACGDHAGTIMKYTGSTRMVFPWLPGIKEFRDEVKVDTGMFFNGSLVNDYLEGANNIGQHRDKEALGENKAVVCLSLGEARLFNFTPFDKENPLNLPTIYTYLGHGDMMIFFGSTNDIYRHGIPVESTVKGERISITLRFYEKIHENSDQLKG